MFYVLVFSLAAVVLVVGGVAGVRRRQRADLDVEVTHATQQHHPVSHTQRRSEKARRAQSRHDRRKRH
ncbi:MAG TPA: hypothetical protein VMF35_02450 [Acidimicrobiales bacterium]|nr:hypothetical protein [Acidimicrobiales bacterium]